MTKTIKFFIICAAVCVLGLILTIAGYAMGGVEGLDKVEENHNWFNIGSQDMQDDKIEVGEYDSIKVEGNADLAIIGKDLTTELDDDFAEDWVTGTYKENLAGNVFIQWKEGTKKPEVKVENGVLTINSNAEDFDFEVNLSAEDSSPNILVFCGREKLKDVDVSGGYGDISIGGIKCESMNVRIDSGDIQLCELSGGRMNIKSDSGDICFTDCKGDLTAETDSGDIEFDTGLEQSKFEVSLQAGIGDVTVNDSEDEVSEYSAEGGPNKLSLKTENGDIDVDFAEAGHPQQL